MSLVTKKSLIYLFIAIGILFRVYLLFVFYDFLDFDEAKILYYGHNLLKELPHFYVYAPSDLRWEMLFSYIYALGDKFFYPRVLSFFFGLADVGLLFLLVRRYLNQPVAYCSALLMLYSPWHIYYSTLLGTCNPVITMILLSLFFVRHWKIKVGIDVLGLWTYATFRIYLFYQGIKLLWAKKYREVGYLLIAALIFIGVILLSNSSFQDFITRGSYNFYFGIDVVHNYLYFLIAPFIPPLDYYSIVYRHGIFMADFVHFAFTQSLALIPPLGYVAILGLIITIGSMIKHRAIPVFIKQGSQMYLLVFLMIGFLGPSLSRMYILLPLLIVGAGYGINFFLEGRKYKKTWWLITCCLLIATNIQWFYNIKKSDINEVVFNQRFFKLNKYAAKMLQQVDQKKIFLLTNYNIYIPYYLLKFKQGHYMPIDSLREMESALVQMSISLKRGEVGYLLLDVIPKRANYINNYFNYVTQRENLVAQLFAKALIKLEEHDLFADGVQYGKVIKFRFQH